MEKNIVLSFDESLGAKIAVKDNLENEYCNSCNTYFTWLDFSILHRPKLHSVSSVILEQI